MNASVQTALKQLRLSGMAQSLDVRLQEAAGNSLTHGEFLELVLQDELLVRKDRQMQRRLKAAQFRELKTLEDFDWQFNPSIKKRQVYDLASGRFVREARDCLWLGPPGTGKSHLCQALGYQAIKMGFLVLYRSIFDVVRDFLEDEAFAGENKVLARYLKPDLSIIDDMGITFVSRVESETNCSAQHRLNVNVLVYFMTKRDYQLKEWRMRIKEPLRPWLAILIAGRRSGARYGASIGRAA